MYNWVVFLHVIGGYGFVLAHGVAVGAALALRRERRIERMRAILDLSAASTGAMSINLLILLVAGVTAGFMGRWWGQGWLWTALGLFVVLTGVMGFGATFYTRLRAAIGAEIVRGPKPPEPPPPPTAEELERLMASEPSVLLTVVGVVGLAVIIWLMRFKPF